MKNILHGVVLFAALLAGMSVAQAAHTPDEVLQKHNADMRRGADRLRSRMMAANAPQSAPSKVVTVPDGITDPASSWGPLYTPDGAEWLYTVVYDRALTNYIPAEENGGIELKEYSIVGATFTIFDENLKSKGSFTVTLPEPDENTAPGKRETGINLVQLSPWLSRKFFHVNDDFEVMVYVHATTEDHSGHEYTLVYSLSQRGSGPFLVTSIEGNQIAAVNTPVDGYDENFTMVFMREEVGPDYSFFLNFDVYHKACYFDDEYPDLDFSTSAPTLLHTFRVDYEYISGSGEASLPILVNAYGGDSAGRRKSVSFALPRYEKPFFVGLEEGLESGVYESYMDYFENPVVTPDNNFIIDLYDLKFNVLKSTAIPMTGKDGYLWSFPGTGLLTGNNDVCWDLFGKAEFPHYIIGLENYEHSSDDFKADFYIYDADGKRVNTIYEDAFDYIGMSDIEGCEKQVCFISNDGETYDFEMVDIPSCIRVAKINNLVNGTSITTEIDRVPDGTSYKYVSSMRTADVDAAGNVLHGIAWFNADGSLDRVERINLGNDVAAALPYINGDVLRPFIFDTDKAMEYLFLVKSYVDPSGSLAEERLRLYDESGRLLLDVGPDEDGLQRLLSVFVMNVGTPTAKLVTAYSDGEDCTIRHFNLPLSLYAGGSGTVADPWLIATEGDMRAMEYNPDGHFALVADIDFNHNAWSGVQADFTGSFDGRGHFISHLNLTGDGIFNRLLGDTHVSNFTILESTTTGSTFVVGEALGQTIDETSGLPAKVVNVNVFDSKATSKGSFGAIIGHGGNYSLAEGCRVEGCDINVASDDYDSSAGAIYGSMGPAASAVACYSASSVKAIVAGGIAGEALHADAAIRNCHSASDVYGEWIAGGIVGRSARSTIDNCLFDGNVKSTGADVVLYKDHLSQANAGGIVGWLNTYYSGSSNNVKVVNACLFNGTVEATGADACIARRIVGSTSSDRLEPGDDLNPDGSYILVPGSTETRIGVNYVAQGETSSDAREGRLLNDVASLGWAIGTDASAPWLIENSYPRLYFEDTSVGLVAVPGELTVYADSDPAVLRFRLVGGKASLSNVTLSCDNEKVVALGETTVNGAMVSVPVAYAAEGDTHIHASAGAFEATADVAARTKDNPVVSIMVSHKKIEVHGENPDPVEIVFTVNGGKSIEGIEVAASDTRVVTVSEPNIDGHRAKVTLQFIAPGQAEVTATLAGRYAACAVLYDQASLDAVDADARIAIVYDGHCLRADGPISVSDMTGRLVASGRDVLDVSSLRSGLYIAIGAGATLKFVVR